MNKTNFFDDVQVKIQSVIDNSPARDIQKNVKATLSQGFSKLDLITREEFDIQTQVLAKTREKLTLLEARITELERSLAAQATTANVATAATGHHSVHSEKHPR